MPPPAAAPSIETAPTGQARDLPARPAPVEERAAPRSSRPATPAAAFDGAAWLASRTARRYTLQLVGGRNRALVEKFVRDHAIAPPYAVFERPLDGRPWYSLVAGDYRDRDAAVAARARLPARLGSKGVWPRTFGSIQNP
jgi:DamX protein